MSGVDIKNVVVRKAELNDLDALLALSGQTGSGMTTMPVDKGSWVEKLERSCKDFSRSANGGSGEIYLFVLEDWELGEVVGCAAIYAGVGLNKPFYSYKLSTLTNSSPLLDLTAHSRLLYLVNDYQGGTELGSLFVASDYRRDGIGTLLSRSRLLFLADFKSRFNHLVFAELRGWLDENEQSPFWNCLGQNFFGLSYQKADFLSAIHGSQFISDLMPKYPVYLDLLPNEAQTVVGKPNIDAQGALHILQKEGFKYTGYVDVFDAGPCVQTELDSIATVRTSQDVVLAEIVDSECSNGFSDHFYMVSNSCINGYRVIKTRITLLGDRCIGLPQKAAAMLNVEQNSLLRIAEV